MNTFACGAILFFLFFVYTFKYNVNPMHTCLLLNTFPVPLECRVVKREFHKFSGIQCFFRKFVSYFARFFALNVQITNNMENIM